MEDEEALESRTLISQLPDPVQNEVDDLLTDGVMASRIVIGGVFLSCDELLRVEQLAIDAVADLICMKDKNTQNVNSNIYSIQISNAIYFRTATLF